MSYRWRRVRARSVWREMAAKGLRGLAELRALLGLADALCTLAAFLAAALLAPLLALLSCVVESGRSACARRLQARRPELRVVRDTTVRSAMDTHRNQGVVTALLELEGRCDLARVRACLQDEILDQKNAAGELRFPHLRMALGTRTTMLLAKHYVWRPVARFSLDDHLLLGSNLFRGRPVSELNIQEYVSEVVSKYLPPELPPWQVVLLPRAGQDERYYLVVRLHHLLLSEGGLGLGQLLRPVWPSRLDEDDENPSPGEEEFPSPFADLAPPLVACRTLARATGDWLAAAWAGFARDHDPVENVDLLKKRPRLLGFAAALVAACVACVRDRRGLAAVAAEFRSRRCTPGFLCRAAFNSCRPSSVVRGAARLAWLALGLPVVAVRLLRALARHCALTLEAASEAWSYCKLVYTAPRILLEDLFLAQKGARHHLQTVSLCGRKVVAWSPPVSLDLVRRLAAVADATPSEVLLAATAGALREYFRQLGLAAPDSVQCAARSVPRLTGAATRGLVCLPLPTGARGCSLLAAVRGATREARRRQAALHLLSSWLPEGGLLPRLLPAALVRLLMNHVTRRYAVTLAEVGPQTQCVSAWGHAVRQLVYWRPPQGNICMALTLMQYGHSVHLGVMTDALLSPQHAFIASGFQQQIAELASASGVQRDRAPSS
ncbi:uncharacterized protein LOC134528033 [Bacillus rossius redtenbacheri]|uniref:uncharacterized protein LOC134528033 n=1 Tax=Bacillus rossius redtenbacheri TaxID=93214 RepID=UPI002FDE63D4